jgi:hypothetical protein
MLDVQELGGYIQENFSKTLFRLETLDQYEVASDGSDFARYLNGDPGPDPERKQPWLDHLRNEAERGLYRHRVHILRSPLSDYIRYECEWGYAYNVRAGEDVRILDVAERSCPEDVVDHDFWLIDDVKVLRMHYGANGQYLGAEIMPDHTLAKYRATREALWQASEQFEHYWAGHSEYWRDIPPVKKESIE